MYAQLRVDRTVEKVTPTPDIATLPPAIDSDYWVRLGVWGMEHAGPDGIPLSDYGTYVCDWLGRCSVCSSEVHTAIHIPFHPDHLGWCDLGAVPAGRTWCTTCGSSAWANLVRISQLDDPEWAAIGVDSPDATS